MNIYIVVDIRQHETKQISRRFILMRGCFSSICWRSESIDKIANIDKCFLVFKYSFIVYKIILQIVDERISTKLNFKCADASESLHLYKSKHFQGYAMH